MSEPIKTKLKWQSEINCMIQRMMGCKLHLYLFRQSGCLLLTYFYWPAYEINFYKYMYMYAYIL